MSNRVDGVKTRKRLLEAISAHHTRVGYSPTVRELASEIGMSVSAVQYHLDEMQRTGMIQRDQRVSRSIRLTV